VAVFVGTLPYQRTYFSSKHSAFTLPSRDPLLGHCCFSQGNVRWCTSNLCSVPSTKIAIMQYYTQARAKSGSYFGAYPELIDVFSARDDSTRIGMASEVGRTDTNVPIWSLKVHGVRVPGSFVVVDEAFVLLERPNKD
jgi:hypothetical protein